MERFFSIKRWNKVDLRAVEELYWMIITVPPNEIKNHLSQAM